MTISGLSEFPLIEEKVNSPQYSYAEILMDLRIENDLDIYQMTARTMLLDVDTYTKMENIALDVSIKDYKQAIRNFHKSTAYLNCDEYKNKPKGIILSEHFDVNEITFKHLDLFEEVLDFVDNGNDVDN